MKLIIKITFTALIVFDSVVSFAQCAMCRAIPSSNHDHGGNIANGLNSGIMYLLFIPYILLISGIYFFFKKPIDEKVKSWLQKKA